MDAPRWACPFAAHRWTLGHLLWAFHSSTTVSVSQAAVTEGHRLARPSSRCLQRQGGPEAAIQAPRTPALGEGVLPACRRCLPLTCVFLPLFIRTLIPSRAPSPMTSSNLLTSQRPHLPTLLPWGQEFNREICGGHKRSVDSSNPQASYKFCDITTISSNGRCPGSRCRPPPHMPRSVRGHGMGPSPPASSLFLVSREPGARVPRARGVCAPRPVVCQHWVRPWRKLPLCPCWRLVASANNWILIKRMGVRKQFTTLARAKALQLN